MAKIVFPDADSRLPRFLVDPRIENGVVFREALAFAQISACLYLDRGAAEAASAVQETHPGEQMVPLDSTIEQA